MSADLSAVAQTLHLPREHAARLRAFARARRLSEDQVVVQALDILFSLADELAPADERRAIASVSEESLARIWENDLDAAYDNWRELYGVSSR
jgi:hypothetical protein